MYNILQKYFSSFVFLIKLLILSGAYYVISDKILNDRSFNNPFWSERINVIDEIGLVFMLLILLLTLINWSLEFLKWQSLVNTFVRISFVQAAKQSLSSLTASLLTPNRIGEYGAKAIYFDKNLRPKVLLVNFLGNAYQMLVTIVFGMLGLFLLKPYFDSTSLPVTSVMEIAIVVVLFGVVLALLLKKWLLGMFMKYASLLHIASNIHKKTFLYAAGRYLVFSHQFYFLLLFFGVDLSYSIALPLIAGMYLISSVIPNFVVFDWLVKGSVAVTLFHFFGVDELLILSITATMWILNFAVPAIVGSFYVMTFKSRALVYSEQKPAK